MPLYGVAQAGSNLAPNAGLNIVCLLSGDDYYLFNAETPGANAASVAVNIGYSVNGEPTNKTFTIKYASAPTAVMTIQGSNTDIDGDYVTLYTSTNLQHDNYTDTLGFKYYRAKTLTNSAGGAITVLLHLG